MTRPDTHHRTAPAQTRAWRPRHVLVLGAQGRHGRGAAGGARRDRGSATVEIVILAPALILVLLFVIAVGRIAGANNTVDAAAFAAARAASISRSAPAARCP